MADQMKQQTSLQHKCPNCGAPLRYDVTSGQMICDHCRSHVDFDKSDQVVERDFSQMQTNRLWDETVVTCYRCSNCGAQVVSPITSLATDCPFCHSPVVIEDRTGSLVRPDSIIPFEVTAEQAAKHLTKWCSKKVFAPNRFRKKSSVESLKGVYIPAWTFDAETSSSYEGTVGYHRTRTVRRNGKTYTETYTEWQKVKGTIDADYDDIFVRANDNVPAVYFSQLQPFDQSKYKVYDDEYLAGFIADHYTLEPQNAFATAKGYMMADIKRRIIARHNADVEGSISVNLGIKNKSFKYMLLPVYIAANKYGGKVYSQYVSGVFNDKEKRYCRVCGKTPVSPWKVALAVLFGLGMLALTLWVFVWSAFNGEGNVEWEFSLLNALPKLLK